MLRQLRLTAERTVTRAGQIFSLDGQAAIRERPPPCKGFHDGVRSLAVMYPASVAVGDRRPRWNPRIDVPFKVTGSQPVTDDGFRRSRFDRSRHLVHPCKR